LCHRCEHLVFWELPPETDRLERDDLSAAGFCESASPKQGVEGTVEPGQRVRWRPHRAFADSRSVPTGSGPRNSDAHFPATPNGTDGKTSNDATNSKNFESRSAPSTVGRAAAKDRMTGRECRTIEPFSCPKQFPLQAAPEPPGRLR
jgi:hypothetical protein